MSTLQTDLNVAPFYDDFNANNQYYRILFRPSTAVQARELTQIQTILQNQISTFGSSIYKDGSIIEGCTFTRYPYMAQVRFKDSNTTTLDFNTITNPYDHIANSYMLVSNTTGIQAVVFKAFAGAESAVDAGSYDTNRAYVIYLNSSNTDTGGAQVRTFRSNEQIDVYGPNQDQGAPLNQANYLGSTYTITSNSTITATGLGYGVAMGPGSVYQKGFFLKAKPDNLIIKEHNSNVAGIQVGFATKEYIVTPVEDPTLYDNSIGSPNYSAPGAYRLKLVPTAVSYDTTNNQVIVPTDFLSVFSFDAGSGALVTANPDPQLSALGDAIAKRTFETSGNYIVNPFTVDVTPVSGNIHQISYNMSSGLAYVDGYRTQFLGSTKVFVNRADTTESLNNQRLSLNLGNYIQVNDFSGTLDIAGDVQITFYNAYQNSLTTNQGTSTPVGTAVGTANVKAVQWASGTKGHPDGTFYVYLYNIKMNSGHSFATDAYSFYVNGTYGKVFADLVPNQLTGKFEVLETNSSLLLYDTGLNGVESLVSNTGLNSTTFVYRTTETASVVRSAGKATATFTLSGSDSYNYSGTLTDIESEDINVYFAQNLTTNALNTTGTIASSNSTTSTITSGSSYTGSLLVGDGIKLSGTGGSTYHSVTNVNSAYSMTVTPATNLTGTISTYKFFKAGTPVNFNGSGNTITFNSSSSATISLAIDPDTSTSYSVYAQIPKYRAGATPIQKIINQGIYVKIDCSTNAGGINGPWSLGFADVMRVSAVYVGADYLTTNPDRISWFILNNGQTDSMYGISTLSLNPSYAGSITSSSKILVKLDYFSSNVTSTQTGFYSIDSYPINDANTADVNAITTPQIPLYYSSSSLTYDLRNNIDFRPIVVNTATSTNVISSASINPGYNTSTFVTGSGAAVAVEPDSVFSYNITHYLPRIDALVINKDNTLSIKRGAPSVNPSPPSLDATGLRIAEVYLPPYPTLTFIEAQ